MEEEFSKVGYEARATGSRAPGSGERCAELDGEEAPIICFPYLAVVSGHPSTSAENTYIVSF